MTSAKSKLQNDHRTVLYSVTRTFRITTCTMRFNSQVLGFTLVAMASLAKADFFANFFDGEPPRSLSFSVLPCCTIWEARVAGALADTYLLR